MPRLLIILSVAFAILWLVGQMVFGAAFPETRL
jgi:hypothetical protein